MPRPAISDPRNYLLTVRLSDREKRQLDRRRGKQTISEYVRRVILTDKPTKKS